MHCLSRLGFGSVPTICFRCWESCLRWDVSSPTKTTGTRRRPPRCSRTDCGSAGTEAIHPSWVGRFCWTAQKYTVIGVLPARFDYPDKRVQLWIPVRLAVSEMDMRNRGNHRFFVTARLKDGVSGAQASSELNGIQQRNHAQFPNQLMGKNAQALLLSENLVRDVKQPLYLLMGAVVCVLLIACLNVAPRERERSPCVRLWAAAAGASFKGRL